MNEPGKRRYDPGRRGRIIAAALDVIAEHGVVGTTHRKVAAAADVPLGSMTYHFADLDELLAEAFKLLADSIASRFTERLSAASDRNGALEAVVDIAMGKGWATPRNLLLSYELYAYAARQPALRTIMQEWMRESRAALERHFAADTARALDALIEGLTIHRSVDRQPMDREQVRVIVQRLAQ